MKKIISVLFLVYTSLLYVFAGDVVKVMHIYNGGVGTIIPLSKIDSINHVKYNENDLFDINNISSITWTLDSIYKVPISSIDSVKIQEVDIEEYKQYVSNISSFISNNTGQDLDSFNNNLIEWLNKQDWVFESNTNSYDKSVIVTLTNGIEVLINYQDISFFEETSENANNSRLLSRAFDSSNFINSSQDANEIIISNPNILLVQGRPMFDKVSYAADEFNEMQDIINAAPVQCDIKLFRYTLDFLKENIGKYGLIIISQTHGISSRTGIFQVFDVSSNSITNGVLTVYIDKGRIVNTDKAYMWMVGSRILSELNPNPNAIFYVNYCFSYGVTTNLGKYHIVGYDGKSHFFSNKWGLMQFTEDMMTGLTFSESYERDRKRIHFLCDPITNHANSKLRFFSISSNEIKKDETNGNCPVITGTINGFKNLKKKDLNYLVYYHEGTEAFNPNNVSKENRYTISVNGSDEFEIDSEGNYTFKFPKELEGGKEYGFTFAFEYNNNIYYGDTNYFQSEKYSIIGAWRFEGLTFVKGAYGTTLQIGDILYINANKTWKVVGAENDHGTWSLIGNQLTFNSPNSDVSSTYSITRLDSSTLEFRFHNYLGYLFQRIK